MIIHGSAPGNRDMLLLAGALLCGCLHHLMFYGKDWGISYPIFLLVFYVYFYWAVKERSELKFDASLLMLLPIMLLSLTYTAFTNMLFAFLNALFIPLLIVIHTTWLLRKQEIPWDDGRILTAALEQLFVHTMSYVPHPVKVAGKLLSGKINASRSKQLWKVLAGIALSLPLLLLVGALLASADKVFNRLLLKLPELLQHFELMTFLFRTGWVVVVSIVLFAYVYGLLRPGDIKCGEVPQRPQGRAGASIGPVDATIAATVLLMINAVYVLFAVVQFSYLFAGGTASLPESVTYAEYARRGFGELVAVTVINFTLLMLTLYSVDRTSKTMDRFIRVLLAMLVGCTGIMLCSAYFRLSMYEEAYGYTVTRVLVHAFMIFLLVLFVIALIKVWNRRFRLVKPYIIVAAASYVLLNYIQVDGIIASGNMKRYEATGRIDAAYLGSLGFEAVPYLLELQQKYPEAEGAEEALDAFKERLTDNEGTSWLSFNVSRWKAAKMLETAATEIARKP